jgi:hypothetical protein
VKIFLSWSGERSRLVASELRDWLQLVINDVEPFISSDIDAGARWQSEIAAELETTEFGILCVTADNQRTAWLNFEGGALAKTVNTSRVVPLAIDLSPAEIQTPLGQFQAQPLSRAGIEKIVASINACLPKPLPINLIEKQIGKWWPDLEQKINEIDQELSLSLGSERPARTDRELLEDILNTVRSLSRISERSGIGRVGLEGLYNALKGDTSADFLESILRRNPEWPDKTLTSLMRDLSIPPAYIQDFHYNKATDSVYIISVDELPTVVKDKISARAAELGFSGGVKFATMRSSDDAAEQNAD